MLGRPLYEPHHTLVLGALIDPHRAGSLGARLLGALIRAVDLRAADHLAGDVAGARVLVERGQRLASCTIVPDIVVELGSRPNGALIVIENKIRIVDRKGQLDDYREWADGVEASTRLLVYLTPHGASPSSLRDPTSRDWTPLSYARLAVAFRAELRAAA